MSANAYTSTVPTDSISFHSNIDPELDPYARLPPIESINVRKQPSINSSRDHQIMMIQEPPLVNIRYGSISELLPTLVPFQEGYKMEQTFIDYKEYICYACKKVARNPVAPSCDCTLFCNVCAKNYLITKSNNCPECDEKVSWHHRKRDKARIENLPCNNSGSNFLKNRPVTYPCPVCNIELQGTKPWETIMYEHALSSRAEDYRKSHMDFFITKIWTQHQNFLSISLSALEKNEKKKKKKMEPTPSNKLTRTETHFSSVQGNDNSGKTDIKAHPAYNDVLRTEAHKILKDKPLGAYLVRPRRAKNSNAEPVSYAISVFLDRRSMSNFLIAKVGDSWCLDKERQITADTIEEVISHAVTNFRLAPNEIARPYRQC